MSIEIDGNDKVIQAFDLEKKVEREVSKHRVSTSRSLSARIPFGFLSLLAANRPNCGPLLALISLPPFGAIGE